MLKTILPKNVLICEHVSRDVVWIAVSPVEPATFVFLLAIWEAVFRVYICLNYYLLYRGKNGSLFFRDEIVQLFSSDFDRYDASYCCLVHGRSRRKKSKKQRVHKKWLIGRRGAGEVNKFSQESCLAKLFLDNLLLKTVRLFFLCFIRQLSMVAATVYIASPRVMRNCPTPQYVIYIHSDDKKAGKWHFFFNVYVWPSD